MHEYLQAIRRRVCLVCIDGVFRSEHEFDRCGLPKDRTCPVEHYLPQVIEIVESIESPRMSDYINLQREKVCTECEQTEDGKCELRLKSDCPLDRYFMLVAGAIEEVKDKQKNYFKKDLNDSTTNCSDELLSPTPW